MSQADSHSTEDMPAMSPEIMAIMAVLTAINQREQRKGKKRKTLKEALALLNRPMLCSRDSLGVARSRKGAIAIIQEVMRQTGTV
jgi:hypothetical protein